MPRITLILLIALSLPLAAAKKDNTVKRDISQAKEYLKKSTNLDQAEKLVRAVVAKPGQSTESNYALLAEIVRKQYESSNEKLYLRQLSDTATLFPALRKMFRAYEELDSVELAALLPSSKDTAKSHTTVTPTGDTDTALAVGNQSPSARRVSGESPTPRRREKNAQYLAAFRPNLLSGALFSLRKKKYAEAYASADTYLDTALWPLFSKQQYAATDTLLPHAAYIAVTAARHEKKHAAAMKHAETAIRYTPKAAQVLAMLYESSLEAKDTAQAVAFLRRGFDTHPEFPYFFPRLIDHYAQRQETDTVCAIVTHAIALEPGNLFYRQAKNNLQLNTGDYDACIALGDSILHANDHMAEAFYNVGAAYFNKALIRDKQGRETKQKRNEVNALYAKAQPYLERYRTLRQKAARRWAPLLYTVYLNLNRGKEFEEIDALMKAPDYLSKKKG